MAFAVLAALAAQTKNDLNEGTRPLPRSIPEFTASGNAAVLYKSIRGRNGHLGYSTDASDKLLNNAISQNLGRSLCRKQMNAGA
jgi:hypothetical protein